MHSPALFAQQVKGVSCDSCCATASRRLSASPSSTLLPRLWPAAAGCNSWQQRKACLVPHTPSLLPPGTAVTSLQCLTATHPFQHIFTCPSQKTSTAKWFPVNRTTHSCGLLFYPVFQLLDFVCRVEWDFLHQLDLLHASLPHQTHT